MTRILLDLFISEYKIKISLFDFYRLLNEILSYLYVVLTLMQECSVTVYITGSYHPAEVTWQHNDV